MKEKDRLPPILIERQLEQEIYIQIGIYIPRQTIYRQTETIKNIQRNKFRDKLGDY